MSIFNDKKRIVNLNFTAIAVNIRQMLVGLNITDYIYRYNSKK